MDQEFNLFTLHFNMDNDSFKSNPEHQVKAILQGIGDKVSLGHLGGTISDVNGNTIGKWEIYN